MNHDIQIIDPSADYEPLSPLPRNDIDRVPYDDIPEIRPSMHQRMSSLSIDDRKPTTRARRDSSLDKDAFMYWRFEKNGDDWSQAYRRKLVAPQNEIEKMAKKGKGSVLSENQKMGSLRSQHLTRLVNDQNASEPGADKWEPVYIKSDKYRRKTGKIECKSMDVILARRRPSPRPAVKKYRSSSGGELVDLISESKPKEGKKDKKKEKEDRSSSPKRDSFLDDPFDSRPLFASSGAPMDDQGPIDFNNAGLPPDIPPDRPIGYAARDPHAREDQDGKKRGKSQGALDDDIDAILEVNDPIEIPSAAVGSLGDILGHDISYDDPLAEPGRRRSRSTRRPKHSRSRSRSRSRNRPEDISFPPSFHARPYRGDHSDSSSTTSNQSRYGIDREERSSYTSQETYPSTGRRGSYARPHSKDYKQHYAGPSANQPKYYHHGDAKVYEEPVGRRRRYSRGSFSQPERIPEARQIGYSSYMPGGGGGDLVRRREPAVYDEPEPVYYPPRRTRPAAPAPAGPILHYPSEMPSDRRAERYMDDAFRDDYLDRRERDLTERERALDAAEMARDEELRRQERYQRERELEAQTRYEEEEMERRAYDRKMRAEQEEKRYWEDRYRDQREYGREERGYRGGERRYYD